MATPEANARTFQCPSCGGIVSYDVGAARSRCKHCGRTFAQYELRIGPSTDNVTPTAGSLGRAKTAGDFLRRATWESDEGTPGFLGYSCPACAARVLVWHTEAATICPYCGNNLLLSSDSLENLPSRIVPFAVTRERAKELLRGHFEDKEYLAEGFDPELEHVQGVYVPFYAHDVFVIGEVGFVGYRVEGSGKSQRTYHYAMHARGRGEFTGIPIDASSRMPDGYMEAIAPFDLGTSVPLRAEYVVGFSIESPDEARSRTESSAGELAAGSLLEAAEDWIDSAVVKGMRVTNAVDRGHETSALHSQLVALPVWLLHCTWEGEDYLFAVNGQTGECVGDLPVNEGKSKRQARAIWLLSGVAAWTPLALIVAFMLLAPILTRETQSESALMLWARIVFGALAVIAAHVGWFKPHERMRQHHSVELAKMHDTKRVATSLGMHAKQDVRFGALRVKMVQSEEESERLVRTAAQKADWRHRDMLRYADAACEEFCARPAVASCGITREYGPPNSSFVPYGETAIPVYDGAITPEHDDVAKSGNPYSGFGFAITDAGLWCRFRKDGVDPVFTSWEEFAWSRQPVEREHRWYLQRCLCVSGRPVALLEGEQDVRNELARLYDALQTKARGVFPWKWLIENRPNVAATWQMVDYAQNVCGELIARTGREDLEQYDQATSSFGLTGLREVYVAYADRCGPVRRSYGFAIVSSGFACREWGEMKPVFTSWEELSRLGEPGWDKQCIRADGVPLAYYDGEEATAEALLTLCRDLRAKARILFDAESE